MRVLALLAILLWGAVAHAQDPRVTVELSAPETLVGQPLDLVVTILVPTWMPKSPVYPTFEVPSLMVRLPEKSTISISDRIDGATWAGVRRTYKLYPLSAGVFRIPSQDFTLTYADPETRDPLEVTVPSPDVVFESVVPEAARGLDPLIVAEGFALEQEVEGPDTLSPGDAVVRTLRAAIEGTTVVMIPALIPVAETPGLRAYPAEPVITEEEARGAISGTREEKVTFLAQTNGEAALPAIRLDWYNIGSGEIETVEVPGFVVTVEGASDAAAPGLSRDQILRIGAGVVVVLLIALLFRRFRPRIDAWLSKQRARWHGSEPFARRAVEKAIRARDLSRTYTELDRWGTRSQAPQTAMAPIYAALAELGQSVHSAGAHGGSEQAVWRKVETAFASLCRSVKKAKVSDHASRLPPLNPF
ncbi:MAG: hypothetical protein QNJ03_06280 [Dinoroseobacter sp.]|nr:hypothetical protein [Dinoroseobacter sp.]